MRSTLKAVVVTGIVVGILLLAATLSLSAWQWHLYDQVQTQQPEGQAVAVARLENPYGLAYTPATKYVWLFAGCCLVATAWVSALVLPSVTAARQLFTNIVVGRVVSATVVFVVSAIAFSATQYPNSLLPPELIFLVGGLLGLIGFGVMALALPPNKSLERTREP